MVETTEDVFRLAQERAAGICQRDVMTAPIEQWHAHLSLELSDLLAERRLRGVQTCGGAREVQLVGHRHEVPQMTQFHHAKARRAATNGNREDQPVSRKTSDARAERRY